MGDNEQSGFGSWLQGVFGAGAAPTAGQPPAASQAPAAQNANAQNWLKMAQLGTSMMGRSTGQQAPQMPQLNIPSGQMQQNLQALMQPTQMMNHSVQGAMSPMGGMESLLNPQNAVGMQQMQGLLH